MAGNAVLITALTRLSRNALIDLCLDWAQSKHCITYLTSNRNLVEAEEEDYLHEPADDTAKLRQFYEGLKTSGSDKAGEYLSRRDIIDRIVDGDWRRGLSLYQLAAVDFAYIEENDSALRWSALKLVPLTASSEASVHPAKKRRTTLQPSGKRVQYPHLDPELFLTKLKAQISPLVKAYYTVHRLKRINLTILRLYIIPNTPFELSKSTIPDSSKHASDSARIMYIALPDSCPFIYVSLSGAAGGRTLLDTKTAMKIKVDITTTKRIIMEAIPKAFSRPQERWSLESTKLTTRSLKSMCLLRGNGRPGSGGGAYSKFSEEISSEASQFEGSENCKQDDAVKANTLPLRIQCPTPPPEEESQRLREVNRRFGNTAGYMHAPLNRVQVKIENLGDTTNSESRQKSVHNNTSLANEDRSRKRKRLSLEEIERGEFRHKQSELNREVNELVGTQIGTEMLASMTITLSGTDVIAGLRQLGLLGSSCVDMDLMPSWMTGERGASGFTV